MEVFVKIQEYRKIEKITYYKQLKASKYYKKMVKIREKVLNSNIEKYTWITALCSKQKLLKPKGWPRESNKFGSPFSRQGKSSGHLP